MKILLSYPRSGNHLVRFFIELLSETPTFGEESNNNDIEIYKNKFDEKIPFNIDVNKKYNKYNCFNKKHKVPKKDVTKIIFIVRNPKEVLLRQSNFKLNIDGKKFSYNSYFDLIDYYLKCNCKKLLLFYEDIIENKINFINVLYEFLDINKLEKKKYVINNIDKLWNQSLNGKGRSWKGNLSNNEINFYYSKIPQNIKNDFDIYINEKLEKYPILNKYK